MVARVIQLSERRIGSVERALRCAFGKLGANIGLALGFPLAVFGFVLGGLELQVGIELLLLEQFAGDILNGLACGGCNTSKIGLPVGGIGRRLALLRDGLRSQRGCDDLGAHLREGARAGGSDHTLHVGDGMKLVARSAGGDAATLHFCDHGIQAELGGHELAEQFGAQASLRVIRLRRMTDAGNCGIGDDTVPLVRVKPCQNSPKPAKNWLIFA